MIPLVCGLWRDVLTYPTSTENKILALSATLQVYGALLGMTDEDFHDLMHEIGNSYSGPLPDGYSEEVIKFYQEINNYE